MSKKWPPQDTGVFAVALCAFCVIDLFWLRDYASVNTSEPAGKYDIVWDEGGEVLISEAAAIAAAEANGPARWNWVAGDITYLCARPTYGLMGGVGLDPLFDYLYTDTWQPSAGVSGCYNYRRLRFRRIRSGYVPGTTYDCAMQVERRPLGGTWAAYATITATLTADSVGVISWEDDCPHAREYETWIAARTFAATPV